MVYGLEKMYTEEEQEFNNSFNLPNSSIEANAGDPQHNSQNSWIDDIDPACPFYFSSEEDKLFKVSPIWKSKTESEIESLKERARTNIQDTQIESPLLEGE